MWMTLGIFACSTPAPDPAPALPAADAVVDAAPPESKGPAERAAPGRIKDTRPPTIDAVTLSPTTPVFTDSILASATVYDADEDRLELDYTWYVNDVEVLGVTVERLSGRFVKGDKVRVKLTADDGTNQSEAESDPVVVGNVGPVFTTEPSSVRPSNGFTFRATDADNDPLTWSLENAPAGMTISPKGVLSYEGSKDEPGGAYTVSVKVSDGAGWARIDFPITVTPGSKAKAAADVAASQGK